MKQSSQNQTMNVDLPIDFLRRQLAYQIDGVNDLLVDCIVQTCSNKESLLKVLLGTLEEPQFSVGEVVHCKETYYHKPEGADKGEYIEYGECIIMNVNPFDERYRYEVQQHPRIDEHTGETIAGKRTHCKESHLRVIQTNEELQSSAMI